MKIPKFRAMCVDSGKTIKGYLIREYTMPFNNKYKHIELVDIMDYRGTENKCDKSTLEISFDNNKWTPIK